MSFLDVLKSGEIPQNAKRTARRATSTNYDEFMRRKALKTEDEKQNVTVLRPKSFQETREMIDLVKSGKGIIVDLGGISVGDAQRMLDYLSGAVYAANGRVERIENRMYLLTPDGVHIVNRLAEKP